MLLRQQNAMFFHIPRCGGTSINWALVEAGAVPREVMNWRNENLDFLYGRHKSGDSQIELDHLTYDQFDELRPDGPLFSFAVVRDPVERFTSIYQRSVQFGGRVISEAALGSLDKFVHAVAQLRNDGLFERPLCLEKFQHYKVCHLLPQTHFIVDNRGHVRVNRVIFLDDLDREWPQLCKRLAIAYSPLRRQNVSGSAVPVTPEAAKLIADLYRDDVSLLKRYELRWRARRTWLRFLPPPRRA